jgi:hypothetical protein
MFSATEIDHDHQKKVKTIDFETYVSKYLIEENCLTTIPFLLVVCFFLYKIDAFISQVIILSFEKNKKRQMRCVCADNKKKIKNNFASILGFGGKCRKEKQRKKSRKTLKGKCRNTNHACSIFYIFPFDVFLLFFRHFDYSIFSFSAFSTKPVYS